MSTSSTKSRQFKLGLCSSLLLRCTRLVRDSSLASQFDTALEPGHFPALLAAVSALLKEKGVDLEVR